MKRIEKNIYVALLISAMIIILLSSITPVKAEFSNITIISLTEQNYSDIWLGISTGGYDLIAARGQDYVFRIFVKNGMGDKSMHNLAISPNNFSFEINSIAPKMIEQVKPMEIVIFYVNATIPANTPEGKYPLIMDVVSDEFPSGIFTLSSEVKVVRFINTPLYVFYAIITLLILVWFFVRKGKIWSEDKGKKRRPE